MIISFVRKKKTRSSKVKIKISATKIIFYIKYLQKNTDIQVQKVEEA